MNAQSTLAESAQQPKTGSTAPKSLRASIVELVVIVAVALGLALGIQAWIIKPFRIPSGSMEPTLQIGQRVLVDRIGTNFGEPHVGDIEVFHPPSNAKAEKCGPSSYFVTYGGAPCDETYPTHASEYFIKRVVAGPGDELYVKEGRAYLKTPGKTGFTREHDSYIKECGGKQECNFLRPIRIPAGHWFMMGDNRGGSDDSRFWGPIPTGWIVGEAIATYWPPDRIGVF